MRKIERHPFNQGSVVTFDMYGKIVHLFVADAKYRAFKKWGAYGTDTRTRSNFTANVNKHINPNDVPDPDTRPLSYTLSDSQLQARFPAFKTDNTAKENTDILMKYDDAEAAHWCRSQKIAGAGIMDMPNIYELLVIYLEADRIDELDPTVNKYKQYALGKLNTYAFNTYSICWSSTERSNDEAYIIGHTGFVHATDKENALIVLPVKELHIELSKKTISMRIKEMTSQYVVNPIIKMLKSL